MRIINICNVSHGLARAHELNRALWSLICQVLELGWKGENERMTIQHSAALRVVHYKLCSFMQKVMQKLATNCCAPKKCQMPQTLGVLKQRLQLRLELSPAERVASYSSSAHGQVGVRMHA
jgi:hypothetical protein